MKGPNLPASRVKKIIKETVKPQIQVSPCFQNLLREHGRNFVEALAIQLNQECENNNGSVITSKVLYTTLMKNGLEDLVDILKVTENNLKQEAIEKKKKKKIIEDNIQRMYKRSEEQEMQDQNQKAQNGVVLQNYELSPMVIQNEDRFDDIEEINEGN